MSQDNIDSKIVDMSTKIGGRVFHPALPVVDSSLPSDIERSFNDSLSRYIAANVPLESTEGIQRRERVLNRMKVLCREWIRSVCVKRGLPDDVIEGAGGDLYTSGSYRLGVHEPGADIDTILVAPNFCKREDFFGEIVEDSNKTATDDDNNAAINPPTRDPDSLAERIRKHPDVTNFVPVEGAAVPILTFDWEGVNIDLLFARLNSNSVPADFDIDNDSVLDGVDSATEKSLNGPRVTNLIAALVKGTDERYKTFLIVVRCVRKWAKARGLYSNKMGYWGGVNINIAVALCVQLYPNATPAGLLRRFFLVFVTWRWPNPVMLTKPHDAGYGLPVWNAQSVHNARQVAPIITPAYPAMNSTLSVSRQTLQIMHEEFCRGHDIVHKLWKQNEIIMNNNNNNSNETNQLNWDELFEPSDFFITYPHYLTLCIVGPTQAEAQAWAGFVESRLRKLVSDMLGRSLPLSKIQLWPKKLEVCIADKSALLTQAQRKNCITYFVGFQIDTLRMRGKSLNVELQLHNFREWELSRFQPLIPGMDVLAKTFQVKQLPKICFENMYGNNKNSSGEESTKNVDAKYIAMKRRRHLMNNDPKRKEKKQLAKLQELKAKMAEIQRKKEEQQQKKEQEQKEEAERQQQQQKELQEAQEELQNSTRKRKRGDNAEEEEDEDIDEDLIDEEEEDALTTNPKKKVIKAELKTEGGEDNNENEAVALGQLQRQETDLLQNALDTIQDTTTAKNKTREEAEADKRKLLSGELLAEEEDVDEDFYPESDDENAVGYTGVDNVIAGKHSILTKKQRLSVDGIPIPAGGLDDDDTTNNNNNDAEKAKNKKLVLHNKLSLPVERKDAELLEQLGCPIVSDDETKILGGSTMLPPWRNDNHHAANKKNAGRVTQKYIQRIRFLEKFDIVELDMNGHVIDKGDDDFSPSKTWIGRRAGFEFKLGERGLGYYRTGKKVVIPSNSAY